MGIAVPDLIIESIIRDGIENLKARPELVDDIFSELLRAYASRKYGTAEIQRIKDVIVGGTRGEIAVVHSFHEAASKSPCYSIQLGLDHEGAREAILDDFDADVQELITDASELAAFEKVTNFVPTAYDATTGTVSVADSVNLADVYVRYLYEDGAGTEHEIINAVSNAPGSKFFMIAKNSVVDLNPGKIKSFIKNKQFEQRTAINEASIMIGCHSKDALMTKYLYVLLKFFLHSRKLDMVARCFDNPVIKGSDFTRDLAYQGDIVFARFLTISGRTEDTWRSDQVDLIDSVEIDAEEVDC